MDLSNFNAEALAPATTSTHLEFCTGFGQFDTRKGTSDDYGGTTGKEIVAMLRNPPSVAKARAQWFIPSTYKASDGRVFEAQRDQGEFWFLCLDEDGETENNLCLDEIDQTLEQVCGPVARMIYSTRSSTPERRKWRALIPLHEPIAGTDYADTVAAFNAALIEASAGVLIPDPALEREAQLIYLPNRGEHYEHKAHKGNRLELTPDHEIVQRREAIRADRREAENAARARRERKRAEALANPGGNASIIEAFNGNTTVADELGRYGYTMSRNGLDWRSPNSTTGSYAVRDFGDFWISLSGSDDALEIGNVSPSGARIGDAFDLFVFYEHGGEFGAAIKAHAEEIGEDHASRNKEATEEGVTIQDGPSAEAQTPPETGPILQDSAAFCAARTPADYLIDGSVRDGWLYTLTAPTGHGKSAVALAIAYAIAKGGYLGSNEVKQGGVLFLAGENADDIRERWIAICEINGDDPADLPVTFMPGVWDLKGSLPALRERFKDNPLRLVVVDTLAAFFDGDNENDNAEQQQFATHVLRPLTELPGRPAVFVPAHPTKGAGKDSLTPKGGSSLLNAVDGNLSAWQTDGTVKVHWQGKFRGAPWRPMYFELSEHQSDQLRDSRGRIMPTVMARAMLDSEIGKATEQAEKVENQVLKLLSDGLTIRDIAADVLADGQRGVSKSRVARVVDRLSEQKWIIKSGRKWALTKQGLAVLQQAGHDVDPDA